MVAKKSSKNGETGYRRCAKCLGALKVHYIGDKATAIECEKCGRKEISKNKC